jgi:hypothetical protein
MTLHVRQECRRKPFLPQTVGIAKCVDGDGVAVVAFDEPTPTPGLIVQALAERRVLGHAQRPEMVKADHRTVDVTITPP